MSVVRSRGSCAHVSGLEPSPMYAGTCAARVPVGTVMRGGDGRKWRAVRSTVQPQRVYWQLQLGARDVYVDAAEAYPHSALAEAILRARVAGTARASFRRVDVVLAAAADMVGVADAAELALRRHVAYGGAGDGVNAYFGE